MSRWWFALAMLLCAFGAWANGLDKPITWFLLLVGAVLGGFWLMVFPRMNLTKRD